MRRPVGQVEKERPFFVGCDGFNRFIDQELITIPDSMALKYSESVNSVHYFSVLPYGLNDSAVKKKLLAPVSIKGKEYYKIEIRFRQEGGGDDFDDVFIYWVNTDTFFMDYLAYQFHTNGGGYRFRAVSSEKLIEGVRFVDYANYKPKKPLDSLKNMDSYFINGDLVKISEINLENIELKLLEH